MMIPTKQYLVVGTWYLIIRRDANVVVLLQCECYYSISIILLHYHHTQYCVVVWMDGGWDDGWDGGWDGGYDTVVMGLEPFMKWG